MPATPPPTAPPGPAPGARPALRALAGHPGVHALLVVLAVAAVYANGLGGPFLFDDWSTVESSPPARELAAWWAALDWGWNRALGDLTFALNRELLGEGPAGYHAVNVVLHAGAALLVGRLAALLLAAPPGREGAERGPALAAALLFAVHPLQTGAVTYVVQRYAVLATLCYLGAVVLWLEARRRAGAAPRRLLLAAALGCTLLAMRSKEIAFTLPLVLLLVEVVWPGGPLRARLAALAPFLATLPLVPASLVAASGGAEGLRAHDPFAARALGTAALSRLEYLLTQLRVIPTYLRLLVLPVDQTFDYDFPVERALTPAVAAAGLLLAALVAAGIWLAVRGRRGSVPARVAGLGVLWFFVALSVESSLVPIDDVIFEHRVYLPSVGFALVVAAALAAARGRLRGPARLLPAALAALAIAALGVAAHLRNEVWGDAVTFWRDAVEKAPRKARPRVNLAGAFSDAGRPDLAVRELEVAIHLAPGDALARFNLAGAYARLGLVDPAVREYEALLRLTPASPATRTTLAGLYLRQGRPDRAEAELRAALAASPGHAPARLALEQLLRVRAGQGR